MVSMCKLVGRTAGHGRNDPRIRCAYPGETNAMLPVGQKCPTSVLPATRGPRWRVECWLAIIAIEPAVSLQRDHTWRRTVALMAGSSGGELVGVRLIPCSLAVWAQFRAASWRARRAGGTEGYINRCSNVQAQGGSATRANLDGASGHWQQGVRVAFVDVMHAKGNRHRQCRSRVCY